MLEFTVICLAWALTIIVAYTMGKQSMPRPFNESESANAGQESPIEFNPLPMSRECLEDIARIAPTDGHGFYSFQ